MCDRGGRRKFDLTLFLSVLAAKNRGYSGKITIGGVPLNEVNETNLMQRVVLVRHNSYLFKGTVEENLKIIAKTFEIASLKAAC